MLVKQNDFLKQQEEEGVAICGTYVNGDSIHVGIYWNSEGESKIIHFLNGMNIPIQDASDIYFQNYLFNPINDFPTQFLPSLAALTELISQNKLNGFVFNRIGVVYDGGKFEFLSGSYTGKTAAEKFVNCAVFVIALLNSFDYELLDWSSWPNVQQHNRIFLDQWLESQNIPEQERDDYYNMTKEVRGRHVIVCPQTNSKPSSYQETETLANELIQVLNK